MADTNKKQTVEGDSSDWASPRAPSSASEEGVIEDNAGGPEAEKTETEEMAVTDEATAEVLSPETTSVTETPVLTTPTAIASRPQSPVSPVSRFKTWFSTLHGKQREAFALMAFVVVVLVIGGVVAYTSFVSASPNRLLQEALANTINENKFKSAEFEGSLQLSGKNVPKGFTGLNFNGEVAENHDFSFTAQVHLTVATLNIDVRRIGTDNLYVRLSGLTDVANILNTFSSTNPQAASLSGSLDPILSQLNNQWYQVDTSALGQFTGGASSLATSGQLSQQDSQKFIEAYQAHPFLKATKRLGDEKIEGTDSYHLRVSIDKTQLKEFLETIKADNLPALQSSQAQLNQLLTSLDTIDYSKGTFEVWIDKSNKMIDQLTETYTGKDGATGKVQISLKNLNKVKSVEKPTGAKSFQDLVQLILPALLGSGAVKL